MIPLALVFLVAGIYVLKTGRPCPRPNDSRLYRIDDVAISVVLFVLSASLLVVGVVGSR